jgi:sporulation protein YlmC with PRC-barrel domain
MSEDFEKTHAKIINKSVFVKQNTNEVIIKSENQMIISYKHYNYGTIKNPESFICKWLNCNNNMRCYDDMEIYPNPKLCPKNVFNLWVPFKCETYITPYVENKVGLNFILDHIKGLCKYEDEVHEYFIKWIAQMIQFPEVKSIMITMISKQGVGKNLFIKLLTLMFGYDKVVETTTPSRDVWGNFNGMMTNAFLVNLNELSKKETMEAEGKIKGLITDSTLTINNKGVNQFKIQSHHRFFVTTNVLDGGIKTLCDDRRNLMIRCSDDKIGDKEYFNKLNYYLDNENVVRTCYD